MYNVLYGNHYINFPTLAAAEEYANWVFSFMPDLIKERPIAIEIINSREIWKGENMTFTPEEIEDLKRAVLFLNVAIHQDPKHDKEELNRIQKLYQKLIEFTGFF